MTGDFRATRYDPAMSDPAGEKAASPRSMAIDDLRGMGREAGAMVATFVQA